VPIQIARSKIEKRLQKLEASLTDASKLVPYTRRWLLYWTEIIARYINPEDAPWVDSTGGVAGHLL
jgi:hypothetical protein